MAPLRGRRADAVEALRAVLDSGRYLALLAAVEDAAAAPRLVAEISLEAVAAAEFKRLRALARVVGADAPDAELHRLRIRCKRARYAAELAQGRVCKPARRFVAEAKRFQDVLELSKQHKVNMRTAAYMLSISRVATVHRLRGIYS